MTWSDRDGLIGFGLTGGLWGVPSIGSHRKSNGSHRTRVLARGKDERGEGGRGVVHKERIG